MSSRFDYVKYDEIAIAKQAELKAKFQELESLIPTDWGRYQDIMDKLEEAYMWCGKAIRDVQMFRNSRTELQEGRDDV